jgi:hypothetical protein
MQFKLKIKYFPSENEEYVYSSPKISVKDLKSIYPELRDLSNKEIYENLEDVIWIRMNPITNGFSLNRRICGASCTE